LWCDKPNAWCDSYLRCDAATEDVEGHDGDDDHADGHLLPGMFVRAAVEEFFKKLDTPIDVAREVFGAGRKQISTFPLVGGTTVVMGLLMSLIFFTDMPGQEMGVLAAIVGVMILFGVLMWYFGKKSEIRSAAQYTHKRDGEVQ